MFSPAPASGRGGIFSPVAVPNQVLQSNVAPIGQQQYAQQSQQVSLQLSYPQPQNQFHGQQQPQFQQSQFHGQQTNQLPNQPFAPQAQTQPFGQQQLYNQQTQQQQDHNQQNLNQFNNQQSFPQQQQQGNLQIQQWPNQNQYAQNQQLYQQGQFAQPYYPPQDFNNPDFIPQKIDLKFYQIEEVVYLIRSCQLLQFHSYQVLFHQNFTQKTQTENEAKVIVKNLQEYKELLVDQTIQVMAEEGYWLVQVSDVDRVFMCNFHNNLSLDWAYNTFIQFCSILNDKSIFNINSGTEIHNAVNSKLMALNYSLEQNIAQNKEPAEKVESKRIDFQQNYFQIGLSQQVTIIQVLSVRPRPATSLVHPAFQATNLWKDFKESYQQIMSLCICLLLIVIVVILLYQFILKDLLQTTTSEKTNHESKHIRSHQ